MGSPFVFILDRLLESLKLEESSWLLDFVWLADAELRDDVNDDIKELGWDGEKDFLSFCGASLNENVVICEIFGSEAKTYIVNMIQQFRKNYLISC